MASFKKNNVSSSQAVLAHQKGKPVIYVEGESDKKIFENFWFVELLEKLSFNTPKDAQGCSAVVNTVTVERRSGIDAFGIVDRDKLMTDKNWSLLRQTNDELFECEVNRCYPKIKVTRRWEIENYLIEPEALEAHLAEQAGRKQRATLAVEIDLLDHANALVPFAALNQALHFHDVRAVKDGYTRHDSRVEVEQRILSEKLVTYPQASNDYHANVPLIDAFAGSADATPRQRLHGLLRAVNGKAMIERIKSTSALRDDFNYIIASKIKQAGRVPTEIADFVRQCHVKIPAH